MRVKNVKIIAGAGGVVDRGSAFKHAQKGSHLASECIPYMYQMIMILTY